MGPTLPPLLRETGSAQPRLLPSPMLHVEAAAPCCSSLLAGPAQTLAQGSPALEMEELMWQPDSHAAACLSIPATQAADQQDWVM